MTPAPDDPTKPQADKPNQEDTTAEPTLDEIFEALFGPKERTPPSFELTPSPECDPPTRPLTEDDIDPVTFEAQLRRMIRSAQRRRARPKPQGPTNG